MIDRLKAYVRSLGPWARDAAERAAATAVQTFIAAVPLSTALTAATSGDVETLQSLVYAAGVAALGAALSVLKSAIARRFGDPESASLDPAAVSGRVVEEVVEAIAPH